VSIIFPYYLKILYIFDRDRVWYANVCKYEACQAKKMRIISQFDPEVEEVKVVGIVTSQGCSNGASFTTTLESTDAVTETSSFTTEKSQSYSISTSMSIEATVSAEADFKFMKAGASLTVGRSLEIGTSVEFSSSETKETSKESSSSAGQSLEYTGKVQ